MELDPSLFYEYWGRWNSPYINHFLSPDTIIPDQTNPQSWNRYSYVNNNPVRYTDPTGHMLDDGCNSGQCGGSAVGTANMFVKIAKNKPQYRKQALKLLREHSISVWPLETNGTMLSQ